MSSPSRGRNEERLRDSPRRRPQDIESSPFYDEPRATYSPTKRSPTRRPKQTAYIQPAASQSVLPHRNMNSASAVGDLGRKKSLIRPERNRIDRDHPNYHYRQHAQNMTVLPSTTGNDPIYEDNFEDSELSPELQSLNRPKRDHGELGDPSKASRGPLLKASTKEVTRKRLQRKATTRNVPNATEKYRVRDQDALRPPSLWSIYCAIVSFWAPGVVLRCFGKPAKAQQRAWREKIGLVSIILMICAFVGYLTFGFTQSVCGSGIVRLRTNAIGADSMIFHGSAYNMNLFRHPGAEGIPSHTNPIYDLPHRYGGQDGSFLFQNVNGACKNLITRAPGSDVPTNADGDLAWYFPCVAFNQDGSTKPNLTIDYYLGYGCHTTGPARQAFYKYMRSSGEVYFTWDDMKNSSRRLIAYNGDVLDLDLLAWFNSSQVTVPKAFDDLRTNPAVLGVDLTRSFQSPVQKQLGQCLQEIIRVGSIDTETVGCIASSIVLYVSLVLILSTVVAKFLLALAFQWFFSRRFAASKSSITLDPKKRAQQIEDWADDIYRAPPKLIDSNFAQAKRSSIFLPSTSRFSSPYANTIKSRPAPTTMANQPSSAKFHPPIPLFRNPDDSDNTLPAPGWDPSVGSRSSILSPGQDTRHSLGQEARPSLGPDTRQSMAMSESDGAVGPQSFIHEGVVPQPPPEWEPFGYPLAHTICLVTAYSEGEAGIRSTLDSIATTEYPNSHKAILVICDGVIKGKGEVMTTPEIVIGMMTDHATLPDEVEAFSYVAVASGSKRHNMAKVYAGYYDYGERSCIPREKQQRVPMLVIVKCGTEDEVRESKPGNRGKRDSQVILMSFLQKVMFDERMTELEFEMFNGLWRITGISPDFYEVILMVDADTKIFPDSITYMVSAMVKDPEIMGLCGETKVANKHASWVSRIQVFEYFISHHLSKSFESVFGGVTCLPGCFSMYRIKAPKGGQNYWVPILANPDVVERYSENVVDTLHKKNLLLLGEDRYLSTLMLRTFPKRKQIFVPQAVCKTTVPEQFSVLLSQRRRWINSTVHNLMELVLVRDLCGTFCFSMQFVIFIELVGTLVLPAAITFTGYLIVRSIVAKPVPVIPLVLLALILGLPAVLIVLTAHRWSYVLWMLIYLLSLPIWNLVLPAYAYWKFDDFSWGDTRKTAGEKTKKAGIEYEGEFDSSKITMKRWGDFEKERRIRAASTAWSQPPSTIGGAPSTVGWGSHPPVAYDNEF